jgi:type II secretory pathway pseudopilin PulG
MPSGYPEEQGFTLLEAMLAMLVGAAFMALLFQLLSADAIQTRGLIARNQKAVGLLQAHRQFLQAAATARGPGTRTLAGDLEITGNQLVTTRPGGRALLGWSRGEGRLDYSQDGRSWSARTNDAGTAIVRFTWRDGRRELVWIAP